MAYKCMVTYTLKMLSMFCVYDVCRYLFMSCRVPGEDIDSVTNHINDMPTHVVIIR